MQLRPRSRFLTRLLTTFVIAVAFLSVQGAVSAQIVGNPNSAQAERDASRRAAVASARGNLNAAQARVKAVEDRVKAEAKANPQNIAAQKELDDAQSELDKLTPAVLAKLKDDPAYKAALQEEFDAKAKLDKEQAKAVAADPASTRPTTVSAVEKPDDGIPAAAADDQSLNVPVPTDGQAVAAVNKLDSRSKRREMELKALADDPTSAPIQARIDAATSKLKQMQAELDARLLNDPDYKSARDALAAARAELTRAAAANY